MHLACTACCDLSHGVPCARLLADQLVPRRASDWFRPRVRRPEPGWNLRTQVRPRAAWKWACASNQISTKRELVNTPFINSENCARTNKKGNSLEAAGCHIWGWQLGRQQSGGLEVCPDRVRNMHLPPTATPHVFLIEGFWFRIFQTFSKTRLLCKEKLPSEEPHTCIHSAHWLASAAVRAPGIRRGL